MTWLLIIILAYLLFGFSSLGDKLVLNRSKSPRVYTFYVGVLSLVVLLLAPFVGLSIPRATSFLWVIFTSFVIIAGLYILYSTVSKFEVSRVVPIVGALQPLFILLLTWIFFGSLIAKGGDLLAFLILFIASIIISVERKIEVTKNLLKLSLLSSFLMSLSFVMIKMVFLNIDFFQGIIWIGIFNFLFVLIFLFNKSFRKEIFTKESAFDKKTLSLVVLTQGAGGLASILQNFAIFLAPASSLAIINALRGVQYAFLFVITLIFSLFYPKILKEEISKKVVIQKVIAILLILVGLAVLVLN